MSVTATLKPLTLLFISSFLMMSSHGLTGILLPVRLAFDGVEFQTIGFILSMYSVGFLLGAILGKRVLRKIGLVRTFAMSGSLGATAILAMGVTSDIMVWAVMRALIGFCIACAMTTLDTWFNFVATETNRGKILAVNQIVILSAVTLGQFGLVLAPPSDVLLFVLCGVLFSISVTPAVFVSTFEPEIEQTTSMPIRSIYKLSPLGAMTCFVCGILYSSISNMLPVYASSVDITGVQLSIFMGAATTGGILLQLPMGYLSDRFERRKVILASCFVLIIVSFILPVTIDLRWAVAPLIFVALTMGLIACLYPLSISETFDRADKAQFVPVLSGLLCIYAVGAIIGPYAVSVLMERFNSQALFAFLIFVELSLIVFTIYRMSVRQPIPVEEQGSFVMQTPVTIHEELDPRTEYQEHPIHVDDILQQVEEMAASQPTKAVALIRGLADKHPEWTAAIAERTAQLESMDTILLFRALTFANPDLSIDLVKRLTETDDSQIEDVVKWLVEHEPENALSLLASITESLDETAHKVAEAIAKQETDTVAPSI